MDKKPNQALRNVVFATTLAVLTFTPCWTQLSKVFPRVASVNNLYFLPLPYKASYAAVAILVLLLSAVLFAILQIASRSQKGWLWPLAHLLCAGLLFFPLNTVRHDLSVTYPSLEGFSVREYLHWPISWLLLMGLTLFFFKTMPGQISLVVSRFRKFVFLFIPYALLKACQCTYGLIAYPAHEISPTPSVKPTSSQNKIVWLLYDEMDEGITFSNRPEDLQLPNLDRFNRKAFHATNAYPPSHRTLLSLPSYITGRVVDEAKAKSEKELLLRFQGEKSFIEWSKSPGLFTEAKKFGARSAIVGSYHPYCRLDLGHEYCSFFKGRVGFTSNLALSLKRSLFTLFPTMPEADYKYGLTQMEDEVADLANRPDYSLLFVHWPFPHSPWMYDPKERKISSSVANNEQGYLGNLMLVDQTLGHLRDSMKRARTWDKALIVITSDHWWRQYDIEHSRGDHRVPILIKAPYQKSPIFFNRPMPSILLHDLVLDALKDGAFDSDKLSDWLKRRTSPKNSIALH